MVLAFKCTSMSTIKCMILEYTKEIGGPGKRIHMSNLSKLKHATKDKTKGQSILIYGTWLALKNGLLVVKTCTVTFVPNQR